MPDGSQTDRTERLNADIQDCLIELTGRIIGLAARLAQRMAIPPVFIKVLHMLDTPMPMKDLGKRMACDPSFVTSVADMLEKRGLARREAHPGDRRVKNLVLTDGGCDLRRRIEAELTAWMPWSRALDDSEREQLIALIRKMLSVPLPAGDPGNLAEAAGSLAPVLTSPLAATAGVPGVPTSPAAGEVNISEGAATAAS